MCKGFAQYRGPAKISSVCVAVNVFVSEQFQRYFSQSEFRFSSISFEPFVFRPAVYFLEFTGGSFVIVITIVLCCCCF